MKIESIILNNFRIYKGRNEIQFKQKDGKNVYLISGKNGFGKTTFLTSLIWGLYGSMMSQVEDKYKKEIKTSGGYDEFIISQFNNTVRANCDKGIKDDTEFYVEIHLVDVMIPSIPCRKVVIRRGYDYATKKESLQILIDGQENELTKEVGFEIFINDFILPREIAKFFFFDAEKIVSLAEAKSKNELRSLSKAYSEVLGIKKYEDLKKNLNTLLAKLRKSGVSKVNREKLDQLEKEKNDLLQLVERNEQKQREIAEEIQQYTFKSDALQEQLIREGNSMTLEELKALKDEQQKIREQHKAAKNELKKLMDLIPLAIAKTRFQELVEQIKLEVGLKDASVEKEKLEHEFSKMEEGLSSELSSSFKKSDISNVLKAFKKLSEKRVEEISQHHSNGKILLDYDGATYRSILATYAYINSSFKEQYDAILKDEKDLGQAYNRVSRKIKEGEARKNNPLAKELRKDKEAIDIRILELKTSLVKLTEELGGLKHQLASVSKVYSEYEKNFKLVETDQEKYVVTEKLLIKINNLTKRIKEEKKYSLQKSILLGLRKLMHKKEFISDVKVRIEQDTMDIDLIDQGGEIINKDRLSKGEQQLYATALLKALVDESGIDFPVFIDSPLQKFDKEHSQNVIEEFYPTISEQVVLYPLLEKELSKQEYEQLKPTLASVFLIHNSEGGSSVEECSIDDLFDKFNAQNYVLAH